MDERRNLPALYQRIQISDIIRETSDVKTFILNCEYPLVYVAGQYLTFVFLKNEKEIRRSYSFSSTPTLNEPLSITFQRIPNGEISRPLFDKSKPGDVLLTTGVAGFFTLPENLNSEKQLIFLAAGSGIVPIYSLLKTALHLYPFTPILLIYSNRSKNETIFYNQLKTLQAKFANNFLIEFLFSTSRDLLKARLNNASLEMFVKRHAKVSLENILFYQCGPFPYMRMIDIELQTLGIKESNVRKEHFDTNKPVKKSVPPDTSAHSVEININGNSHLLHVQYPVSILQEAKKRGIALPYSCEVGKCGSCAAHCLKGKVWMMYNEVLTDEEIKRGIVLTCNSFPVYGDVVLKF